MILIVLLQQHMLVLKFTRKEFDELVYCAREAQIRFMRLRTQVRNDPSSSHWTEEECDEKIAHYQAVERDLVKRFKNLTGENWY